MTWTRYMHSPIRATGAQIARFRNQSTMTHLAVVLHAKIIHATDNANTFRKSEMYKALMTTLSASFMFPWMWIIATIEAKEIIQRIEISFCNSKKMLSLFEWRKSPCYQIYTSNLIHLQLLSFIFVNHNSQHDSHQPRSTTRLCCRVDPRVVNVPHWWVCHHRNCRNFV